MRLRAIFSRLDRRLFIPAVAFIAAASCGIAWLFFPSQDPFRQLQWKPAAPSTYASGKASTKPTEPQALGAAKPAPESSSGVEDKAPPIQEEAPATPESLPPAQQPPAVNPSPPLQIADQVRPSVAKPQSTFAVQIGAFSSPMHAHRLARRAEKAAFHALVASGTLPDGTPIFRVQVDQALSRSSAKQLVAILKSRIPGVQPVIVPREP